MHDLQKNLPDPVYVKIQLLRSDVRTPIYASDFASGLDLHIPDSDTPYWFNPGEAKLIRLGIALEIPPGWEGQVRSRSGLAYRHQLAVLNAPGTIDADYRGEIAVLLKNHHVSQRAMIEPGERIAQLVIAPVSRACLVRVESLDQTVRGAGGFGSTGR